VYAWDLGEVPPSGQRGRDVSGAWRVLTSIRTTLVILLVLSVLLLLNVLVPQAATSGGEALSDVASSSTAARFFLVVLGLAEVSTSPLFLAVVGLFFVT